MKITHEEINTEQTFRFHAVILHNNINRLARMMIDNPNLSFLIRTVNQANLGTYVNPEGQIEEACRNEDHYLENIREMEHAIRKTEVIDPGPDSLEARIVLHNSIIQCERIITFMDQEMETAQSP